MKYSAVILAQASNWQRLGDGFSGDNAKMSVGELLVIAAAIVGAVALLWGMKWLANRQEHGSDRPDPKRLFNELCLTHNLERGDRLTLRLLAEAWGIEQPAELFLLPELFEEEGLPESVRGDAGAIGGIAEKVFPELYAAHEDNSPEGGPALNVEATEAAAR